MEESLHLPHTSTMIPPSQGHRAVAESSDRSLNGLLTNKNTNEDDDASKYYTSAASSIFSGDVKSRFTTISERKPHEESIPGLGDYELPVRENASAQPESSRPNTLESASNILLRFGLEKEDLEQLVSYPEDQITPQNLPFILGQIRQQKTSVSAVHAAPYPEPKPTTSMSDTDFRGPMREVSHQDYRSHGILKTSKVIDYGHVSQFSAGSGEEEGMISGAHSVGSSTLLMDSSGREVREMRNCSLMLSCGLDSALSFKISSKSLPTSSPLKHFLPPSKYSPLTESVPLPRPKTATDSRILPGVSKSLSLSDTASPGLNDPHRPRKHVSKVLKTKKKQQQQEVKKQQPAAPRSPTLQVDVASAFPSPAQMCDYAATTPEMFPHCCSLCNKECFNLKEWINHQNTKLHLRNCKRLLKRFPGWDGELLTSLSASDKDIRSAITRPLQSSKNRRSSSSRSSSGSFSLPRHRSSGSRREREKSRYRSRSRSNSPHQSFRRTRRSRTRSRSQSPLCRSTATRHRSRSRSYERRSSLRRDDRRSSANRSRSKERRFSEKSSARQKPSGSAEVLAQKLLGSSVIQALTNPLDLESMVKSLAPVLLTELTKMRTSRSSSSFSVSKKGGASSGSQTLAQKKAPPTKNGNSRMSSSLSKAQNEASKPVKVPHSGKQKRLADSTTPSSLPKVQNDTAKAVKCPKSRKQKRAVGSTPQSSLSKAKSVRAKHVKVPKSKKQKRAVDSTTPSLLSKAQYVAVKPVTVHESEKQKQEAGSTTPSLDKSGNQKQAAGSTSPSSLSKAQNVLAKSAMVPNSEKQKQEAGSTMQTLLSKTQNVPAKHLKDPESEKQKQAVDSTTPSLLFMTQNVLVKPATAPAANSIMQPSVSAAAKKPARHQMTPPVLNNLSQLSKYIMSGPKAPRPDKKGSTSSEKTTEQKDKEAVVKVEEPPDKAEKPAEPSRKLTLVEILMRQDALEEKMIKDKEDAKAKRKADMLALTPGEMLGKNLLLKRIACVEMENIVYPEFFYRNRRVLQITNLPKFEDGSYSEQDVVDLLTPFGFPQEDEHLHNIYVIPQIRMALALMPTAEMAIHVTRASLTCCFTLSGCNLTVKILEDNFRTPMEFYQILMMWINQKISLNQEKRVVFIKNISPSDARNLGDVLKKIDNVKNYTPLLNKVFIEFDTIQDVDRVAVWYSLLKKPPQHSVYRLGLPQSTMMSPPPKNAEKALPDPKWRLEGASVPKISGIPRGCCPPFYVTMTTHPFIFPTSCPWFNIPACHSFTLNMPPPCSSTIMMTGLPEDGYTQQDVARMVWGLFDQRNIITLFYRVLVLPLQRRAFIFFNTPQASMELLLRHSAKPFHIKDQPVDIHVVTDGIKPEFTENLLCRQLMNWSNVRVNPHVYVEKRLVLIYVSEVSLELIQAVMKEVVSVGPVEGFLPLGNRICIMMCEPSDKMKMMNIKLGSLTDPQLWEKVVPLEAIQSVRHLDESLDMHWAAQDQNAQDQNAQDQNAQDQNAQDQNAQDCRFSTRPMREIVSGVSKRRKDLIGPENKRCRSQSDVTLPTYNPNNPNNPLNLEFLRPRFFCNICSVFYENTAMEDHCSSRIHYNNLQKHFLNLKTTPSKASIPTSSNVSSDGV